MTHVGKTSGSQREKRGSAAQTEPVTHQALDGKAAERRVVFSVKVKGFSL